MFASIFDVSVHITFSEIITGLILYGIIHGIYKTISYGFKQLETETGKIIQQHVKAKHSRKLKHCDQETCELLV